MLVGNKKDLHMERYVASEQLLISKTAAKTVLARSSVFPCPGGRSVFTGVSVQGSETWLCWCLAGADSHLPDRCSSGEESKHCRKLSSLSSTMLCKADSQKTVVAFI